MSQSMGESIFSQSQTGIILSYKIKKILLRIYIKNKY